MTPPNRIGQSLLSVVFRIWLLKSIFSIMDSNVSARLLASYYVTRVILELSNTAILVFGFQYHSHGHDGDNPSLVVAS